MSTAHACAIAGCKKPCSPHHLMCLAHWSRVTPSTQTQVSNLHDRVNELRRGRRTAVDVFMGNHAFAAAVNQYRAAVQQAIVEVADDQAKTGKA